MDVIIRQHPSDDLDPVLRAHLTTDITDPKLNIPPQNLVAILGRPNEVVAVIVNAMLARGILHDRILQKMNLTPSAVHFLEDTIIGRFFLLKHSRLKDGGFRPRSGY